MRGKKGREGTAPVIPSLGTGGANGLLHAPRALTTARTEYVAEWETQLVQKYRITQKPVIPARNRAPDRRDHRSQYTD